MLTHSETADHQFQILYNAGKDGKGTFSQILAFQSYKQLNAVFDHYEKLSKRSIEKAIDSEFSGDKEEGLLALGKVPTWQNWGKLQVKFEFCHVLGAPTDSVDTCA